MKLIEDKCAKFEIDVNCNREYFTGKIWWKEKRKLDLSTGFFNSLVATQNLIEMPWVNCYDLNMALITHAKGNVHSLSIVVDLYAAIAVKPWA